MNKFQHLQSAHCENGVTSSLLKNQGYDFISEPLAFGIGAGLFYFHLPYFIINNGPIISFRTYPSKIFKRVCNELGVKTINKRFKTELDAKFSLDELLKDNIPVGCQVGVFNLSYFPKEYRFHFNAHNIIVYGKEDDRYLISDPVMETVTSLSSEELNSVRFAKGLFAPKGRLYIPVDKHDIDNELISRSIARGINRNINTMLKYSGPITGYRGIRYTAKRVKKIRDKIGLKKSSLYLGQIVRMQEEIGTGGGGFRFLYAAFLEEAHQYIHNDKLFIVSDKFTEIGDMWRSSAVLMSKVYKGKNTLQSDFNQISDLLFLISQKEKEAFSDLYKLKL